MLLLGEWLLMCSGTRHCEDCALTYGHNDGKNCQGVNTDTAISVIVGKRNVNLYILNKRYWKSIDMNSSGKAN